jgi:hypothetical protein
LSLLEDEGVGKKSKKGALRKRSRLSAAIWVLIEFSVSTAINLLSALFVGVIAAGALILGLMNNVPVLKNTGYGILVTCVLVVGALLAVAPDKVTDTWWRTRLGISRALYKAFAAVSYIPIYIQRLGPAWILAGFFACYCGYRAIAYRKMVPIVHGCAYAIAEFVNTDPLSSAAFDESAVHARQLVDSYNRLLPEIQWTHPGLESLMAALDALYPENRETPEERAEDAALLPSRIPNASALLDRQVNSAETVSHAIAVAFCARLLVKNTEWGTDADSVGLLHDYIAKHSSAMRLLISPATQNRRDRQTWEAWSNALALSSMFSYERFDLIGPEGVELAYDPPVQGSDPMLDPAEKKQGLRSQLIKTAREAFESTTAEPEVSRHGRSRASNNWADLDIRQLIRIGALLAKARELGKPMDDVELAAEEWELWTNGEARLEEHIARLASVIKEKPSAAFVTTYAQASGLLAHSLAMNAAKAPGTPYYESQVALVQRRLEEFVDCVSMALWGGSDKSIWSENAHDLGLCWVVEHSLQGAQYGEEIDSLFLEAESQCDRLFTRFGVDATCSECVVRDAQRGGGRGAQIKSTGTGLKKQGSSGGGGR